MGKKLIGFVLLFLPLIVVLPSVSYAVECGTDEPAPYPETSYVTVYKDGFILNRISTENYTGLCEYDGFEGWSYNNNYIQAGPAGSPYYLTIGIISGSTGTCNLQRRVWSKTGTCEAPPPSITLQFIRDNTYYEASFNQATRVMDESTLKRLPIPSYDLDDGDGPYFNSLWIDSDGQIWSAKVYASGAIAATPTNPGFDTDPEADAYSPTVIDPSVISHDAAIPTFNDDDFDYSEIFANQIITSTEKHYDDRTVSEVTTTAINPDSSITKTTDKTTTFDNGATHTESNTDTTNGEIAKGVKEALDSGLDGLEEETTRIRSNTDTIKEDISDIREAITADVSSDVASLDAQATAAGDAVLSEMEGQTTQGLDVAPDSTGIKNLPVTETVSDRVKAIIPDSTDEVALDIDIQGHHFKIDPAVFQNLKSVMAWAVYLWTLLALAEIAFPIRVQG